MVDDADMHDASTSSDDSDFAGVEVSEADMNAIIELEARLEAHPADYDAYVVFIDVLRRCGMRERLKEVRRAMQARFPLSESLWLDWVTDELDAVASEEDIAKIESLLETAHNDYLSIALWIQHLELVNTLDPDVGAGTTEGLAKIRGLYERALAAGGLHVVDGPRLWDWAVAFEAAQASKEDIPAEQRADAESRVRELYRRRLAAPLEGAAEALAAYEAWEEERKGAPGSSKDNEEDLPTISKQVKRGCTLARRAFELREPFEAAVAAAAAADPPNPSALLSAYLAYIKVEESGEDSSRVRTLYERAVAAFPVTHFLWLRYGRYMEGAGQEAEAEAVYRRAVRNCPWVGEAWARLLRAQERAGAGAETLAAIAAAAAAAGLQGPEDVIEVALAHAEALRRQGPEALEQLREVFSAATAAAAQASYFDPQLRIPAYWADCEVVLGGNNENSIEKGRQVWENCLSASGGTAGTAAAKHAAFWLGYIDFERRHAADGVGADKVRALFTRCCSRAMEGVGQAEVCRAWLRFEREHGSPAEHLQACLEAEPVIAKAEAAAEAAAAAGVVTAALAAAAAPRGGRKQQKPPPQQQPKLSKEEQRAMRQQKDPNFAKRRRGDEEEEAGAPRGGGGGGAGAAEAPAAKKPRPEGANAADEKPREPSGAPAPAPGGAAEGEGDRFAARRPMTAFVKHLPEDASEDSLRELFAPCGSIRLVKLGIDRETGRHRGFAYVEFESPGAVDEACKLHGTTLGDRKLFVAAASPPGAGGAGGNGGARGRGRGDRGRGRGGGGRGRGGPRGHLDLGEGAGASGGGGGEAPRSKPGLGFMPRAAAIQKNKGGDGGGAGAPKSNDEFRKMLLEKK